MDFIINLLVKLITKFAKTDKQIFGFEITDESTFKRYLKKYRKIRRRKVLKFFILTAANTCFFIYMSKYEHGYFAPFYIQIFLIIRVLMYITSWDSLAENRYCIFISKVAVRSILPNAIFKSWDDKSIDEFVDNRVIMYGIHKGVGMHIYDNSPGEEFEYFNLKVDTPHHSKLSNKDSLITTFDGFIIKKRLGRGTKQRVRIITSDKEISGEKIYNWPSHKDDEQKVDVENIIFNENFEVYSNIQQEAFMILNPYVTEKILELRKLYNKFSIVVKGDYLYLAIKKHNGLLSIPDMSTNEAIDKISIENEIERVKYLVEFAKDVSSYISGNL